MNAAGSPLCYVAMPFGRKEVAGQEIDFDDVWARLLEPSIAAAGLVPMRADAAGLGGVILKPLLELVLGADVMIADVTGGNPNVLYELGIRHLARPRGTILVSARVGHPPLDLSSLLVTFYDPATPEAESASLTERLSVVQKSDRIDSPVHELIPGVLVQVPDLDWRRYQPPRHDDTHEDLRRALLDATRELSVPRLHELEPEVRAASEHEPELLVDLLLAYRDSLAWDDAVRVADSLPSPLRDDERVVRQLALAMNRRGGTGDNSRAAQILEELLERQPGDGETLGVLGRVYKDRWQMSGDPEALERAIDAYRGAWQADADVYAGLNLAILLARRGDSDAHRDELQHVLPSVRELVAKDIDSGRADYWTIASGLELAVLAGDWAEALALADAARSRQPSVWMLESTANNVRATTGEPTSHEGVSMVVDRLLGEWRSGRS